jgi:uncharacterized protein (TIGR03663 family)
MIFKSPAFDNTARRVPRFTAEIVLWGVVGTLALVLRLANLGAAPLAVHEARQALLSWRAVTGQGVPEGGYSPFLFVANAVLFALCGTGDALARVWPVLLGSAFVLTPLLFRQRVGRVGVLAAGLYLAISPTALFASRQLDGAVAVALGGAVFFGGGLRFIETGNRNWLILAAIGLALALTSGSSVYGMMLALGLAWLAFAWGWPASRLRWLGRLLRPHLGVVLVAFAAAILVFATGLGWNQAGVGATADLFPAWFARLGTVSLLPLTNLAIYEPLALLTGLVGLVWFVRRKRRFGVLLGLWIGLGFFLLVAFPPQVPAGAMWIILPLALLGGVTVEAVMSGWRSIRGWRAEWVYGFITGALWVYLYLRFSSYGLKGDPLDLVVGIIASVSPLLLLALAALVFALISGDDRVVAAEIIRGARSALRGVIVSTGIVLLAATFSVGWGVMQVRPADPRELLVYEPTAPDVRDLVQALRDLSWRETGLPTTLEFTYEAQPDSVLTWYLRDFTAARRVDSLQGLEVGEQGTVIVTLDREWVPGLREGVDLVGQDFVLRRSWNLSQISCALEWPPCNEAVEWLIQRIPVPPDHTGEWSVLEPVAVQQAIIWAYLEQAENDTSYSQ